MMVLQIGRRGFMSVTAAAGLFPTAALGQDSTITLPPPIGRAERLARIAKVQRLMREAGLGAILIEAGSSLDYFTGVQWRRSERLMAAIIPAEGEPLVVTPFFEEPSVRESLAISADVRMWQEDESPAKLIADWLRERRLAGQPVGIEETTRYFAVSALAAEGITTVSDAGVVSACRRIKSSTEIALMQAASDILVAAYRETYPQVAPGMTPADIGAIMSAAIAKRGARPLFTLVLLGEAAAYPHGTGQPQQVKAGEVVLMDCGCAVHGYQADISRTWVHSDASAEQRRIWAMVREGQQRVYNASRIGAPAGQLDDAVRSYYSANGLGPDYALPGLSHRTGHGIGMDGHEAVNIVRGETMPLAPGMCFSNEPGIYLPDKFGIRLEDCIYMTDAGPKWFSIPPSRIEDPMG